MISHCTSLYHESALSGEYHTTKWYYVSLPPNQANLAAKRSGNSPRMLPKYFLGCSITQISLVVFR